MTTGPDAQISRGSGSEPQIDLLVAVDIKKSFGHGLWPLRRHQPVLQGADLTLRAGEVVGLVGENGSDKSTLMKILVGALAADSGAVTRTGELLEQPVRAGQG